MIYESHVDHIVSIALPPSIDFYLLENSRECFFKFMKSTVKIRETDGFLSENRVPEYAVDIWLYRLITLNTHK